MDNIEEQKQISEAPPPKKRSIFSCFSIFVHVIVIILLLGVLFYYLNEEYFNKPIPKLSDYFTFSGKKVDTGEDKNTEENKASVNTSDSEGIVQYNTKPKPGDYTGILAVNQITYNTTQSNNIKILTPNNVPRPRARVAGVRTTRFNNYRYGDIAIGSYTIKQGDTMWEIAEGAYGNGRKWIDIVRRNNIAIDNRNQPVFETGQVINIPKL